MKILVGSAAWIEGKKYKEGSSIPEKYHKEFEKFLVEVPDTTSKEKKETPKESTRTKSIN